jgi:hypothetical protein
MAGELPDYYFRIRDNGAAVFRVDTENRQRRIDMAEIAMVNVKNGVIKPHGDTTLTDEDISAIRDWLERRIAMLARRDVDDIHRTIDHLNLTTHWAQTRAEDAALEEVTDSLLLAMHDLRSVLVRRKAERLLRAAGGMADEAAE